MSKTFLKLWNASEELFKKIENLEKENSNLKTKLKIAEEYINFMASGNCPAEVCEYHKRNFEKCLKCLEVKAQQVLQKMKEVDINNNSNPKKTIKIFGKEIDEDVARKALQEVLDEIADYEEECKKNGQKIIEVQNDN